MLKWTMALGLIIALACSGESPLSSGDDVEITPTSTSGAAVDDAGTPPTTASEAQDDEPPADVTPAIVRICEEISDEEVLMVWGEQGDTIDEDGIVCQIRLMELYNGMDALNPELNEGIFEDLAVCQEENPAEAWNDCYQSFLAQSKENLDNLEPLPGLSDAEVTALEGSEIIRNFCVAMANQSAKQGINSQALSFAEQCLSSMDPVYSMAKMMGHNADEEIVASTRCMEEAPDWEQAERCQQQVLDAMTPNR